MGEVKSEKISGRNRKRRSTRIKVYLYNVCISYLIYCLMIYI